jgi:hypothetical protein
MTNGRSSLRRRGRGFMVELARTAWQVAEALDPLKLAGPGVAAPEDLGHRSRNSGSPSVRAAHANPVSLVQSSTASRR